MQSINKIKFKHIIIILMLIFCLTTLIIQIVSSDEIEASIIYVNASENGNFSTIQDAIDYANPKDIIYVKNGIYYENIVIDKSIILLGENNTNTIIDGRLAGNVIKINSNNVEINNFTIKHSGIYFPNSGINITSKFNKIINNNLNNNFYGITLYYSSSNIIESNIVEENNNCGIYMTNSSNNTLLNNIIKNHTYNGIGIYDNSNYNIIKNNNFIKNGYCAINIRISSMNDIKFNDIIDNNIGIHIPSSENIIDKNNFSNNNVDIDKEILTPGFEIIILVISIALVISYKKKIKKRDLG